MIPDIVKFTGLEIDPDQLLNPRCHRGVIPASWYRVRFEHAGSMRGLVRWLNANMDGRYAISIYNITPDGEDRVVSYVVIAFESLQSAILFKLKDGASVWREEEAF